MIFTIHETPHGTCIKASYKGFECMAESRFDAIAGIVMMIIARGK
jgi:hypothetical protein